MRQRLVLLILLVACALAWPPIPVTNSSTEFAWESTAHRPVWPSVDEPRRDPPAVILDAEALRREFGGEVASVTGSNRPVEKAAGFKRGGIELLPASPANDPWTTAASPQPFHLASKVDVDPHMNEESTGESASMTGELTVLPPASDTTLPEIDNPLPPLHPGSGYLELPAPPR